MFLAFSRDNREAEVLGIKYTLACVGNVGSVPSTVSTLYSNLGAFFCGKARGGNCPKSTVGAGGGLGKSLR